MCCQKVAAGKIIILHFLVIRNGYDKAHEEDSPLAPLSYHTILPTRLRYLVRLKPTVQVRLTWQSWFGSLNPHRSAAWLFMQTTLVPGYHVKRFCHFTSPVFLSRWQLWLPPSPLPIPDHLDGFFLQCLFSEEIGSGDHDERFFSQQVVEELMILLLRWRSSCTMHIASQLVVKSAHAAKNDREATSR